MYSRHRQSSLIVGHEPCGSKGDSSHDDAVRSLSVVVDVPDEATRSLIIHAGILVYPKRKWARGRHLINGIPSLGLNAGDRVEPAYDLDKPGIMLLDPRELETRSLPMRVMFWRSSRDSTGACRDEVVRYCPIWNLAQLGTSPYRSLMLDSLHLVNLGLMSRYVSACLWRILIQNPWDVVADSDTIYTQVSRKPKHSHHPTISFHHLP